MTKSSLRLSGAIAAMAAATSMPAFAQSDTAETSDVPDQIIVTASPIDKDVDDLLIGASVVGQDEIRTRMSNTIGELLKNEPGVSSTFFGPGASRPIIRGQGGDRIRVLDNGIGSIDASSTSVDHAVAVEPAQATSVEVIRGSGLLRYGSSGAGGVVNVIDGRIPSEVPDEPVSGDVRVGGSTVDEGRSVAGAVDIAAGRFGETDIVLHLDGALRESHDYEIPGYAESAALRAMEEEDHDGEQDEHDGEGEDHDHEEEHHHAEDEEAFGILENSAVETGAVSAGISFLNDRFSFGMAVKQTDSTYGIPAGHDHAHGEEDHEHDEDHDEEDHEDEEDHDDHDHEGEHGEEEGGVTIDLKQTRYDFRGDLMIDSGFFERLSGSLGIADYEHVEIEPSGEPGTVFTNEGYEGRLELMQRERNGWRGASGVQYRYRDYAAIGEEAFVPPTETRQTGIFTFQDVERGAWHYEAAARIERTEHEASEGPTLDFTGFSASFGAGHDLSASMSLGGTVFRTERAPTTEELFANGPHLATESFEIGDPDLDLEVSTGGELVWRGRWERVNVTLNAFYTDYDGFIYEAATGEEEDELPVFAYRAADATFSGFEAEGDVLLAQFDGPLGAMALSADTTLEYVQAEIDEGSGNLPRIPPFGALIGLTAESDLVTLRGEVDYAAEQDEIADFELPTDSYTLVNFFATVRPFANPDLAVRLAVENATDEEARQHASFLKDQVPLPGRNVRLSLEASF